jgi:hypothetical protein
VDYEAVWANLRARSDRIDAAFHAIEAVLLPNQPPNDAAPHAPPAAGGCPVKPPSSG